MMQLPSILRCPDCLAPGSLEAGPTEYRCRSCKRIFPMAGRIPELLPDDLREKKTASAQDVLADGTMTEDRKVALANLVIHDRKGKVYEDLPATLRLRGNRTERRIGDTLRMAREWAGGGSLVDLGTGTGYLLDLADGIFEERVGLDVSLGMMGQNRNPAVVLIRADLMRSPFVDGSFHVVASNGVLQMLADPAAFIREAARLLKPGGVFYADHVSNGISVELNRNALYRSLRRWYQGTKPGGGTDPESQLNRLASYQDFHAALHPDSVRKAMLDAGFEDVRIVHHTDSASLFRRPVLGGPASKQLAQLSRFLFSFHFPYRELSPYIAVLARKPK